MLFLVKVLIHYTFEHNINLKKSLNINQTTLMYFPQFFFATKRKPSFFSLYFKN